MAQKNQHTVSPPIKKNNQDSIDQNTILAPNNATSATVHPKNKIPASTPVQSSSSISSNQLPTKLIDNTTLVDSLVPHTAVESNTIKPGSVLKNRFDILEVIGSGGMGTVYKALDKRDVEAGNSCFIAIKVLNDECQHSTHLLQALYEETKKTQSLAHKNIVTVYDFDRDTNLVYMTMELIDGAPLDKIIKRNPNGINIPDALDMINQIANALSYAHSNSIIHLDLKPNNIFYDRNKCIKILDFGISQKFNTSLSDNAAPSAPLGLTPSYASIEALSDEPASPSDDLYAFGCICYEILTGKHPYKKERANIALRKKRVAKKIKSLNSNQWKALKNILELEKQNRTKSFNEFLLQFNKKSTWLPAYLFSGTLVILLSLAFFYFRPDPVIVDLVPSEKSQADQDNKAINNTEEKIAKENNLTPSELIEKTTPASNYSPLYDPQKNTDLINNKGKINLWLNKKYYRIGSTLKINFSVSKELYVLIFLINSTGELTPLFPNPYQTDNLLKPNKNYQIPPSNASFSLDISGPKGVDKIVAFADVNPIPVHIIKIDALGNIINNKKIRSYIKNETSFIIK